MARRLSGKRYAQAIFELALEADQAYQFDEELRLVAEVFEEKDFVAFLKHAEVPGPDKSRAVANVLGGINPLVRNMVDLLVSKGMVDAIPSIHQGYTELLDRHLGRQRVEVTTAVPLGDAERDRISRFVADLVRREIVLTTRVDESILGGLVIQIGDRLLDGSTRARLDSMRDAMRSAVSASHT